MHFFSTEKCPLSYLTKVTCQTLQIWLTIDSTQLNHKFDYQGLYSRPPPPPPPIAANVCKVGINDDPND